MKSFQSGFIGKQSPVQLFWGSFDLAASRYRGRPAPRYTGSAVNCPEWVMEEAYSGEESAAGWWAQIEPPGPAFYAYTYPAPEGIAAVPVSPAAATWDEPMGLFMLPYDAVRELADPDAAVLDFLEIDLRGGCRPRRLGSSRTWSLPASPGRTSEGHGASSAEARGRYASRCKASTASSTDR